MHYLGALELGAGHYCGLTSSTVSGLNMDQMAFSLRTNDYYLLYWNWLKFGFSYWRHCFGGKVKIIRFLQFDRLSGTDGLACATVR
jgi:hypothetical protein